MTPLFSLLPLLCLLTLGVMPYRIAEPSLAASLPRALDGRTVDALTIYEVGEIVTGTPAEILAGLHFVESSCGTNLHHPDPQDRGDFGLHESPAYRSWRVARHGLYDAMDPAQAAIEAGRIYQDNLASLGDEDLAICAHLQGAKGVRDEGPAGWYLARVKGVRG